MTLHWICEDCCSVQLAAYQDTGVTVEGKTEEELADSVIMILISTTPYLYTLGCPKKNFFGISFPRLNHWCGLVPRAPEKNFSVIDP